MRAPSTWGLVWTPEGAVVPVVEAPARVVSSERLNPRPIQKPVQMTSHFAERLKALPRVAGWSNLHLILPLD
jgi:hypothetical protein